MVTWDWSVVTGKLARTSYHCSDCICIHSTEIQLMAARLKCWCTTDNAILLRVQRKWWKSIPTNLRPLLQTLETVTVCTAECERGFSLINLIVSPTWNSRLKQFHVYFWETSWSFFDEICSNQLRHKSHGPQQEGTLLITATARHVCSKQNIWPCIYWHSRFSII